MAPSLRANYFYNACITGSNLVIPLISFSYITPIFRPEIFGLISFSQSIVSIFLLIASAGIPLYGAREIAKCGNDKHLKSIVFSELVVINFAMSIIAMLLYTLVVICVPKLSAIASLMSIYGALLAFNMFNVDWAHQGEELYRNIAVRNTIFRLLMLAAIILFVNEKQHYILFSTISVLSTLLVNLSGYFLISKHIPFRLSNIRPFRHTKSLAVLVGGSLTASVYLYVDTALLGFLTNDYYVGLYSAASRINRVALTLVLSLGNAALPRLSRLLAENKKDDYLALLRKSFQLISFCAIGSGFFFLFFSHTIICVLSHNSFSSATIALQVLSSLFILTVASNFLGFQILFPNGKEHVLLICTSISALINISANFFLIPKFYHTGTAVSALLAEATALVILFFAARKQVSLQSIVDRKIFIFFLCGACAGLLTSTILSEMGENWVRLIGRAVGFSSIYIGLLIALRCSIVVELISSILPQTLKKAFMRRWPNNQNQNSN